MTDHEPIRIPSAQRAALLRAEIRNALPIARYLALLHQAVTEGRIPDTDAITGKPRGTSTEVPIKDRLAIAQYLVNKVLPDRQETIVTPISSSDMLNLSPEQLRALPVEQLVEVLNLGAQPVKDSDATQP